MLQKALLTILLAAAITSVAFTYWKTVAQRDFEVIHVEEALAEVSEPI